MPTPRHVFAFGLLVAVGCTAQVDSSRDASSGEATTAEAFPVERCHELLTQADCAAAAGDSESQDTCGWIEVRVPGPTCASDVAPQCVGLSYVGAGCQSVACDGSPSGDGVDGFFRQVGGGIQVFANPSMNCGLVALYDGWVPCVGAENGECSCLCSP